MQKFKCVIAALASFSIFTALGSAQQNTPRNESTALTERAASLFAQGKLDEAIDAAEKVVSLERKASSADSSSYVNALVNLARMKRDRFLTLRKQGGEKGVPVSRRIELSRKAVETADSAKALYLEAIKLNEAGARARSTHTADIKSDLAWLIYNYFPADNTPSVAEGRSRIDTAESLFLESLALNEQLRGADATETMVVVLALGNFYQNYHNYDKAMGFYDRYIQTVRRLRGNRHADLVNALRPYAQILHATFRDTDAQAVINEIEQITGKKEDLPLGKLGLNLRSKESVAFNSEVARMARTKARLQIGTRQSRAVDGVPVKVSTDETGKVIEAVAETDNPDAKKRAEQEVLKWTVRPFSYNGATYRLRGYLRYLD